MFYTQICNPHCIELNFYMNFQLIITSNKIFRILLKYDINHMTKHKNIYYKDCKIDILKIFVYSK